LPGVDIIVGGHSHTPMGLPVSLHGSSFLEYPELLSNADGDPVVIVQAWQNMAALGILDVTVDGTLKRAVGRVCLLVDAKQKLPDSFSKEACVLRPQPDSAIEQWLIPRREALKTWGSKTLAALPPGVREDRLQTGYWVAASMAQATGAHIAIMNAGGVRESLKSGSINHRDIYSVLPFGNALVTIDLTGEDLSRFIETGLLFARYRNQSDIFYMHGIELAPDCVSRSFCSPKSIILLKNGMREALDPESTYRIVVNSFMASGGDGYVVSPNASVRSTDILDRDAFAAYLGMLFPPPETE
jgi:5'-nucleotidase